MYGVDFEFQLPSNLFFKICFVSFPTHVSYMFGLHLKLLNYNNLFQCNLTNQNKNKSLNLIVKTFLPQIFFYLIFKQALCIFYSFTNDY